MIINALITSSTRCNFHNKLDNKFYMMKCLVWCVCAENWTKMKSIFNCDSRVVCYDFALWWLFRWWMQFPKNSIFGVLDIIQNLNKKYVLCWHNFIRRPSSFHFDGRKKCCWWKHEIYEISPGEHMNNMATGRINGVVVDARKWKGFYDALIWLWIYFSTLVVSLWPTFQITFLFWLQHNFPFIMLGSSSSSSSSCTCMRWWLWPAHTREGSALAAEIKLESYESESSGRKTWSNKSSEGEI